MGSFEYNHHEVIAKQLDRVERSIDDASHYANSGVAVCSQQPTAPRVYPMQSSDRNIKTSTMRSRSHDVYGAYATDASPREMYSARSATKDQNRNVRFASGSPSPRNSNVDGELPVWDRLLSFSQARDEEIARRRQIADEYRELNVFTGCTFHPRTNHSDDRPPKVKDDAHMRLYNAAVKLRQKKEETVKFVHAKREKEWEKMRNFRATPHGDEPSHSNAKKYWDRLYPKPEKKDPAPVPESPKKKSAPFNPEKAKKGLAASLRLYKTAAQMEQNKVAAVRRRQEESDARLQREMAAAGLHTVITRKPMSGLNTPNRVASPSPNGRVNVRGGSASRRSSSNVPNLCPAPRPPQHKNLSMNLSSPRNASQHLNSILSVVGDAEITPLNSSRAKAPTPPPELANDEAAAQVEAEQPERCVAVPFKTSEQSDTSFDMPDEGVRSSVCSPEPNAAVVAC